MVNVVKTHNKGPTMTSIDVAVLTLSLILNTLETTSNTFM